MLLRKTKLAKNQDGMAAIIVSVMIITLISLIVIAMSQNANREQRQALDRQLSNQAFYNAESGINDVQKYLRTTPGADEEKNDCAALPGIDNKITPDGNDQYSCIMYDQTPPTLEYSDIGEINPKVIPISSKTGVQTLTISWEEPNSNGDVSGCPGVAGKLPKQSEWPGNCRAGVLRAQFIPSYIELNRAVLANRGLTTFLVPRNGGSAAPIPYDSTTSGDSGQGRLVDASCSSANTPRKCKANLTVNIPAADPPAIAFLVLRSMYKASNVTIGPNISAGRPVEFRSAQVVIDSTGKSSDVLERLQVRVPVRAVYSTSGFALQTSDAICKLYNVYPDNGTWQAADRGCDP